MKNPNRIIGGYKAERNELIRKMKGASFAVRRDLKRKVDHLDCIIATLTRLERAAA